MLTFSREAPVTQDGFPGEFEQMLLLAILRLGAGAYGAALMRELRRAADRRVSRGSVYVTLDRMQEKGWVTSESSAPLPERGGRPRRVVSVTPAGLQELRKARRALLGLWNGLEDVLDLP
jgi:DNA-binding PadR family transcriptional regulator